MKDLEEANSHCRGLLGTNPLVVCLAGGSQWRKGGRVSRRKEDLLAPTTLTDTTSRWDFEGWERCSYFSDWTHQLLLAHIKRTIWHFGDVATQQHVARLACC